MSSSLSADANLIKTLNDVSNQINRYLSLFIFIFGISGNVLNILVFLHRTLRSNSCASLFLVTSIANIICMLSGLTSRMLSGWAADLTSTINWLCKLRVFIVWVSRAFVMWTIMWATVDRWLLSSAYVHYRRISTLKNARRAMLVMLLLSILINVDLPFCYQANLVNAPLKCYSNTETCRFLTDLTFAFIMYTIPLFFMVIFGLLTIRHVRQAQYRRIHPTTVAMTMTSAAPRIQFTNSRLSQVKKVDRRLLKMHLIQVIMLTIFTLPVAIQRLYSTFTLHYNKSPLHVAIDSFIFNTVILFNYASSGLPFYIFTLYGGRTFRNAFWHVIQNLNHCIRHQ